jgi:NAD-dependent dihydropyrimidine dehydrogenase PreA subunit
MMYVQDKLIDALQQKLQAKQQQLSEIVEKLQGASALDKANFQEQTREGVRMETRIGRCCVSVYNGVCVRVCNAHTHTQNTHTHTLTLTLTRMMYVQDKLIDALQQTLQAKQQEHSEIVEKLQGASYLEKANFQEQTAEKVRMETRIGSCCVGVYNGVCVRMCNAHTHTHTHTTHIHPHSLTHPPTLTYT